MIQMAGQASRASPRHRRMLPRLLLLAFYVRVFFFSQSEASDIDSGLASYDLLSASARGERMRVLSLRIPTEKDHGSSCATKPSLVCGGGKSFDMRPPYFEPIPACSSHSDIYTALAARGRGEVESHVRIGNSPIFSSQVEGMESLAFEILSDFFPELGRLEECQLVCRASGGGSSARSSHKKSFRLSRANFEFLRGDSASETVSNACSRATATHNKHEQRTESEDTAAGSLKNGDPNGEEKSQSSFVEVVAQLGAKLRSGVESGQMFSIMADPAINQLPGILVQEFMKEVSSGVTKSLVDDGAKKLYKFMAPPSITDSMVSAFDSQLDHSLMTDAAVHTTQITRTKLEPYLWMALNETLTEAVISNLAGPLTKKVNEALETSAESILKVQLTRELTRQLTEGLTRSTTRFMAHVFGRAVTRQPVHDYYCYYCETQKLYCSSCLDSTIEGERLDRELTNNAAYYANYYGQNYASLTSEFVRSYEATESATGSGGSSSGGT